MSEEIDDTTRQTWIQTILEYWHNPYKPGMTTAARKEVDRMNAELERKTRSQSDSELREQMETIQNISGKNDILIREGDGAAGLPPRFSTSERNAEGNSTPVEIEDDFADVHFYGGPLVAPPPQEFLWGENVPEGHVSILAGAGGSGKSTFVMGMAFCMAMGQKFLGEVTKKSKILYVDFELDKDTFDRRAISIANGMNRRGDVPEGIAYWRTKQFMSADEESVFFRQLGGRIAKFGFDLVIIDSFTMGSAGVDNIESSNIIAILQRLADLPVTVLCLDHIPHAASNMKEDANPFGSVFKKNAARSIMTLFKDKNSSIYTFSRGKANFAGVSEPIDYAMSFTRDEALPGTGKYNVIAFQTLETGFAVPGLDAVEIVEAYIAEHGTCPTTSDIQAIAEEKGLDWTKSPSDEGKKKKVARYLDEVSRDKKEAAYDQGTYKGIYKWKDGKSNYFTTYACIGGE